ncbi:MAG: TonB-dependent receptor, partial [Proteobacteria bacterium]|nr:TonB-dependent receptor [Pseudomonadota bacterium]
MSSPNIFTFATLSLLSFSPSYGQELPVEEVVITASRVAVAREQSGSAITVIDGSTLRDRQIPTVFDALRDVPGVAVSRTGALGGLAQIRIRGGEANHTLTLIDGVEANDPAASS